MGYLVVLIVTKIILNVHVEDISLVSVLVVEVFVHFELVIVVVFVDVVVLVLVVVFSQSISFLIC